MGHWFPHKTRNLSNCLFVTTYTFNNFETSWNCHCEFWQPNKLFVRRAFVPPLLGAEEVGSDDLEVLEGLALFFFSQDHQIWHVFRWQSRNASFDVLNVVWNECNIRKWQQKNDRISTFENFCQKILHIDTTWRIGSKVIYQQNCSPELPEVPHSVHIWSTGNGFIIGIG